jgi:hypothetical protein
LEAFGNALVSAMNTEKTAAIIARAVGVALVIMGGSSLIGFIQFLESAEMAKSAIIAFLPCVVRLPPVWHWLSAAGRSGSYLQKDFRMIWLPNFS